MKIRYLGHSSFQLIESTGTTVVTDPYADRLGCTMPKVTADAVTVSHHHYDHDAVEKIGGSPMVIDKEGSYDVTGVEINSIRSFHDNNGGKERGENIIFKFSMDGVDICHMGDIGEDCNAILVDSIAPVNVLMIPVGGNYTIDAEQAKEFVDRIMPDVVIPMHYKTKDCNFDIARLGEFLDLFDDEDIAYTESDTVEFERAAFDGESTKAYGLERCTD